MENINDTLANEGAPIISQIENLTQRIESLLIEARKRVATSVNSTLVYTYFEVGRYIVEEEQQGGNRATYGKRILQHVSQRLTEHFGNGWSYSNLRQMRQFYVVYSKIPTNSQLIQSSNLTTTGCQFVLPWTHYQILMRIDNPEERRFYEIEAYKQTWSKRQLQRQYASSLYERLALSRDKDKVMRLANEGQTITTADDIIKNPVTLEFLGLKPDSSYSESDLESAIITRLQQFLLEMGKGFLFEARQKRFTFNEDNYYVDLVCYNRLLQCYVLVDLKTTKLSHQDLGQMQMYVNYYDRYVKEDFEKPTIGILLCKDKEDALVELTLPKDANIYAQQYGLCLPDKTLLRNKLKEWIDEWENER